MNFFKRTNQKRETPESGGDPLTRPAKPVPAEGPQPSQSDFFYGSAESLRKKRKPQ